MGRGQSKSVGKDTIEIFKIDISSITTGGVKASYREFAPQLLKPSNFPNPFIGTTIIDIHFIVKEMLLLIFLIQKEI